MGGRFQQTVLSTRQLDSTDINLSRKLLGPGPENGGTASRIWKTKKAQARLRLERETGNQDFLGSPNDILVVL